MSGVITVNRGFPTPPPEAQAVGFTRLIFFDDFESTNAKCIDNGNTLAPGFNWYISVPPWINAETNTVTNSIVTMNQSTSGSSTVGRLSSVGWTSSTNYTGWTITASQGFYIEASYSFDPSLATGNLSPGPSWPAFWLADFTRKVLQTPGVVEGEIDIVECVPTGIGTSQIRMFDFVLLGSTVVAQGGGVFPGSLTYTKQNKYAALLMPMALNGGNGYLKRYANDVLYPTITNTWTAGSTFAPLEKPQYMVTLDCGFNWPIKSHWVAIWGP